MTGGAGLDVPARWQRGGVRTIPGTRYQGSKRKLCPWLWSHLGRLEFETALDAFGGTGSVAYMLKTAGKRVTYTDVLRSNEQIAVALVENDRVLLDGPILERLLQRDGRTVYPTFIADTFSGIYFTDVENAWLDVMCTNIMRLAGRYERALAWYALFQAAIIKRPYNLFHRRNLYMRTAEVPRSFGNKSSWDGLFEDHFRKFAAQANGAVVDGRGRCRVLCQDALAVAGSFDLVYADPPYINGRGTGVDYAGFYHFLEGMLDYDGWRGRIDWNSKHRRIAATPTPWTSPNKIHAAFAALFERHSASILAVSYRGDGIPSIEELVHLLRRHKRDVKVHERRRYQYALSKNRRSSEVLIIGQ